MYGNLFVFVLLLILCGMVYGAFLNAKARLFHFIFPFTNSIVIVIIHQRSFHLKYLISIQLFLARPLSFSFFISFIPFPALFTNVLMFRIHRISCRCTKYIDKNYCYFLEGEFPYFVKFNCIVIRCEILTTNHSLLA